MALLLMIGGAACADGVHRGVAGPAAPVEPTPHVEGTLRAAVGATVEAASRSSETAPRAPTAERPPITPRAAARPAATAVRPIAATPTAAPITMPAIRVEPSAFNAYRLQSAWTFVQGFVQNSGAAPAGSIQVVVSLIADGDTIVASVQAHVKPDMLKPGDRFPWLAQVQGVPDFQRVRVQVHAQPLTDFLRSTVTQDFQVEGVTIRPRPDQIASPVIAGEVTNVGDRAVTEVEVTAAIYDGDGALYQVARTMVQSSTISPGQSAPFEIRPLGRGLREIPRYDLFVEGRPLP